jgi:hypothetical protein
VGPGSLQSFPVEHHSASPSAAIATYSVPLSEWTKSGTPYTSINRHSGPHIAPCESLLCVDRLILLHGLACHQQHPFFLNISCLVRHIVMGISGDCSDAPLDSACSPSLWRLVAALMPHENQSRGL